MNKMRRSDRAMEMEQALELLRRGEYGILSTVDSGGQAYGTPLSYVLMEGKIYFHCALEGIKLRNILNDDRVCFTVVGRTKVLPGKFSTEYESVMAFGRAQIIEGEEKISVLKMIIKKYSPGFITEGDAYIERAKDATKVVRITLEDLTGKHRDSR